MKQNPFKTASTAIDPMPLPTSPRRDDILVEACFYLITTLTVCRQPLLCIIFSK